MNSKEITNVILVENLWLDQDLLKKHIKTIHEGERNYKCDSCGKSFTQSGILKTHIKTVHERQRNYKCESCGKLFSQSGHLNDHKESP